MKYIFATYTTSKHLKNFLNAVVFVFGFQMLYAASLQAQDPFITIWKTDNPGTSNDDQITISTISSGYNYDVAWGDGTSDTGVNGNITHTYTSPGIYTVEIGGSFPRIYFNNGGDKEKILSVEQWGDIGWTSMDNSFYGASNLVINATDAPDLSSVIMLNHMFDGASSMNSDINHWDVSNVRNMHSMFYGANVFNQDLNGWDVSNVTIMTSMFTNASVFNGDISTWDVSNVTHMVGMFQGAGAFNGDISNWDISSVMDMLSMFNNATAFNADISGWDVSGVTDMRAIFDGASTFNQDIGGWDVSGQTNMFAIFTDASAFNQNLGGWNVENVTSMFNMLTRSGLSVANYDATLTGWATQNVQSGVSLGAHSLEYCTSETDRQSLIDDDGWTITGDAFQAGCTPAPFNPFITTWQTDNPGDSNDDQITIPITGTGYDFTVDWGDGNTTDWQDGDDINDLAHTYGAAGTYTVQITGDFPRIHFNDEGDREKILSIEQWGEIEWSSMENAFSGASNLTINAGDVPDLGAVASLVRMFSGASVFNQNIGGWEVSGVTDMRFMFEDAISFNQDIGGWEVSGVTNMYSMFAGASAFNQEIGGWDVSAVGNTSRMFYDASAFNQDIGDWDVSNVTDMSLMFFQASSFNQDIAIWETGNVTAMNHMFGNATAFNGDIGGWDVSGVTNMDGVFSGASSFNQDISGWDVSGVESMATMFLFAGAFNQNIGGWDISGVLTMTNMLSSSGLSQSNYDATLIGWEFQSVQNNVTLGAAGLEYCNSLMERQSLIDDDGWTISGDSFGCTAPEADDGRILAGNLSGYAFAPADFSQTDNNASVIIKTIPTNGDLELAGTVVSSDDEISVTDIDNGEMTYMPTAGGYGANYDSFDFKVKDAGGIESTGTYAITIDLGVASVELSGEEGWQFLANPSIGDTYGIFLDPIWTKGITGSDDPGASSSNIYTLNQGAYIWEALGDMNNTFTRGKGFIVYVYSDDNNDGNPNGFPKALTSGENWESLENVFEYSGLYYDPNQGSDGNSHFLIANPHPIPIDFCEMFDEASLHIANSIDVWDTAANGGNGDYVNVSCSVDVVMIPPFRSFWIRTTDENPELQIPESAYEGIRIRKEPDKSNLFYIELSLADEDEIFSNRTHILFSETGSNGLDVLDAPKLDPSALTKHWLSFHSLDMDGNAYALQSLPDNVLEKENKITIPLDIQTTEAGQYSMNWNLPASHVFSGSYYLRDNVTGEVVELQDGSGYGFEIAPDQTSKVLKTLEVSEPRFELLVTASGVDGFTELGAIPGEFELAQNYPNPFNPTTVISYQLPAGSEVRLEVYDMLGRRVASLVERQIAAGRHTVNFDASGLSSGVYLYRLQAGNNIMTKKLTVVK